MSPKSFRVSEGLRVPVRAPGCPWDYDYLQGGDRDPPWDIQSLGLGSWSLRYLGLGFGVPRLGHLGFPGFTAVIMENQMEKAMGSDMEAEFS